MRTRPIPNGFRSERLTYVVLQRDAGLDASGFVFISSRGDDAVTADWMDRHEAHLTSCEQGGSPAGELRQRRGETQASR